MSETLTDLILDQMLEPLSHCFNQETAQRLADFQVDPVVQKRVDYLAGRANDGLLTPSEQEEYGVIVQVSDLIMILKLKARRHLKLVEAS